MCAVINNFIGFMEYLLFVQSSDRGLFEAGYFATNIYDALQFILVFLAVHCIPLKAHFKNL